MRALRWHARRDIRLEDVPSPEVIAEDDVIIAVDACGICGSDIEEVLHGPVSIPTTHPHPITGVMAPVTLGHEIVGHVVSVGEHSTIEIGARVVPTPVIWCGTCAPCLDGIISRCESLAVIGLSANGGLAEFVRVQARQCILVPDHLAAPKAALVEPFAVAIHALKGIRLDGLRVAVVGFGSVGSCVADVALARGAEAIIAIDSDPRARKRALAGGADASLTPDEAKDARVRLVVEASGASRGVAVAVAAAAPGGSILVVSLRGGEVPLPLPPFVYGELTIKGRVGHDLAAMRESVAGLAANSFGSRFHEIEVVDLDAAIRYLNEDPIRRHGRKIIVQPGVADAHAA